MSAFQIAVLVVFFSLIGWLGIKSGAPTQPNQPGALPTSTAPQNLPRAGAEVAPAPSEPVAAPTNETTNEKAADTWN